MLIKLIDVYSISESTAKALFGYKIHEVKDSRTAAKQIIDELTKKADEIRAGYSKKGQELNEECAVTEQGKVITTVRNLSKEEIDLSVRRVAKIVKIGMFMDRYPAELSGGQQQRVAIARTLAPNRQYYLWMNLFKPGCKASPEMRYELQRLHRNQHFCIYDP